MIIFVLNFFISFETKNMAHRSNYWKEKTVNVNVSVLEREAFNIEKTLELKNKTGKIKEMKKCRHKKY